jgi:hypothetical protein
MKWWADDMKLAIGQKPCHPSSAGHSPERQSFSGQYISLVNRLIYRLKSLSLRQNTGAFYAKN